MYKSKVIWWVGGGGGGQYLIEQPKANEQREWTYCIPQAYSSVPVYTQGTW